MSQARIGSVRCTLIFSYSIIFTLLMLIPVQSVFATSSIARRVATFCAPLPTMPDVNSCSACHSTTNDRGPNDLTAAGMWALSSAQFINFCPTVAIPTPPGGTGPSPGTGMGMGSGSTGSSMGMGVGGSMDDDDDDDDDDHDDDDDDSMPPPMIPIPPVPMPL